VQIPMEANDATYWDEWWRDQLSKTGSSDKLDGAPLPLTTLSSRPEGLAAAMVKCGLRTVPCNSGKAIKL
jgi:hypothetical protein